VIEAVRDLTLRHRTSTEVMLCSAYKRIDAEAANDPNAVKVVLDQAGFALYFSRSQIPYPREECREYLLHLGIYGYTKRMLDRFCLLKSAPLENIEKLEQLRALYHGYKIAMCEVHSNSKGIDTPQDLEKLSF